MASSMYYGGDFTMSSPAPPALGPGSGAGAGYFPAPSPPPPPPQQPVGYPSYQPPQNYPTNFPPPQTYNNQEFYNRNFNIPPPSYNPPMLSQNVPFQNENSARPNQFYQPPPPQLQQPSPLPITPSPVPQQPQRPKSAPHKNEINQQSLMVNQYPVEIRGGVKLLGCDCAKKNGLQDHCGRTLCRVVNAEKRRRRLLQHETPTRDDSVAHNPSGDSNKLIINPAFYMNYEDQHVQPVPVTTYNNYS